MSRRFRPIILTFHAVSDDWHHPLSVSLRALERHVRLVLRRGYRPATAREVVSGNGRLLHVTFDDGYRSAGDALPVLRRLGVPATVFACTDFTGENGQRGHIPESVALAPGAPPIELETMTWDDLRAISEAGVEVGAHTVTHPHLTALTDRELERELCESREKIEAELGRPCPVVAYPYGDEDERVHAAARAAGFEAAFAIPGRVRPLNASPFPGFRLSARRAIAGKPQTVPTIAGVARTFSLSS